VHSRTIPIHDERYRYHNRLQNKETTEHRRDEDNGANSKRSKRELAGTERGGGALAGGGAAAAAASGTSGGDSTVRLAGKVGIVGSGVLATGTRKTGALTGTGLEELGGTGGESRKLVSLDGDVPGLGLVRALGCGAAGLVATVVRGVLGAGKCVLEGSEVVELLDAATADLNETVLGVLLAVLVNETSRVNGSHVLAVDGLDLVELALVGVAAVLGQAMAVSVVYTIIERGNLQDRNAVVAKLLDLVVPTSTSEGVGVAPRVVVEGEEVAADGVVTAVHVVGHLVAVGLDIGSGVTDGNLAELAGVQVRLDVTGDSLDVRSAVGGSIVVDDLVTREEQQGVVELGELLDGGEDALEVVGVVRLGRRSAVDRVLGGADVEGEVDASIGEGVHALLVVASVVDGVDADGVDAELLELGNVTLAASSVGDGILCIRCATWRRLAWGFVVVTYQWNVPGW
jgi:hypothetical protein